MALGMMTRPPFTQSAGVAMRSRSAVCRASMPRASRDVKLAAERYAQQRPSLRDDFLEEIERALASVHAAPDCGHPACTDARRVGAGVPCRASRFCTGVWCTYSHTTVQLCAGNTKRARVWGGHGAHRVVAAGHHGWSAGSRSSYLPDATSAARPQS